jgi:hypothetical protein
MVMVRAFEVIEFMRKVISISGRQPAALHGNTMQGQQHQQKNTDNPAHDGNEGRGITGL